MDELLKNWEAYRMFLDVRAEENFKRYEKNKMLRFYKQDPKNIPSFEGFMDWLAINNKS